ncbi:hypothetical protein DES53_107101 [Roseimicrobium gellanilyticum]|uniref:Uncharacterized protein n=2 Tax=Roseimicrobium gellanilyticum TaxID=748857 RepID=A0A366HGS2_9BACT|nr:hypothetical protein DES53_107101 [Roseimicrobium gellanilyticum]
MRADSASIKPMIAHSSKPSRESNADDALDERAACKAEVTRYQAVEIGGQGIGAEAIGAQAIGVLALSAVAVGAIAIGALAIGRLVIGRAKIRRLEIDELVVRRLRVIEDIQTGQTLEGSSKAP